MFALTATLIAKVGISSDAGRLLSAIRDNEMRCAYLGLDTARIRIALLVLCAIVAALAGSGYAGFGGIAAPENASFTFGTQLVIMVALGGRGTLVGAIAGALLIEDRERLPLRQPAVRLGTHYRCFVHCRDRRAAAGPVRQFA